MSAPVVHGLIVAGGQGLRFGTARAKQYIDLCEKPTIAWSLEAFDRLSSLASMIVVCTDAARLELAEEIIPALGLKTAVSFAPAGSTRQESVFYGLETLSAWADPSDVVVVHDAARPLVQTIDIERTIEALSAYPECQGALLARPVSDTLKQVQDTQVVATVNRDQFWLAQTPQTFTFEALMDAHRAARSEGFEGTDDASLIEWTHGLMHCVESFEPNIKLTHYPDLCVAEALMAQRLQGRSRAETARATQTSQGARS